MAVAGDKVGPLAALPRSRGNPEALDPGRSCPGSQPITSGVSSLNNLIVLNTTNRCPIVGKSINPHLSLPSTSLSQSQTLEGLF